MTEPLKDRLQRRTFLTLALGWCSTIFALGASLAAAGRFLVPNVLYEPNSRFKALRPDDYPEGPTFLPNLRVFLFREGKRFRAVSAVCTHLGCTVNLVGKGFHCPCHGSVFAPDGGVQHGPAPKPLEWFEVTLARDGQLKVDKDHPVPASYRLMV